MVWSLQPCLARRAKLNCLSCLKPITPLHFGSHIFSQLSQAIFLASSFWPHQKFLIMLINSSQSAFDNLKHLMVYVGIAWATTLINTSLPALANIFSFHPTNFLRSFSLISLKVFLLFFPTKEGNPKYFSCCFITCAPSLCYISSWIAFGVLRLKNKDVLARFNYWPEASHTLSRFVGEPHILPKKPCKISGYHLQRKGRIILGLHDTQQHPS